MSIDTSMKYLARPQTRILLFLFAVSSAIFIAFPQLDLRFSGLFYEESFHLKGSLWEQTLHHSVPVLLVITIFGGMLLCIFNYLFGKNICALNMRKMLYLFLVLVIGSGIIVNLVLKNHSGRARPVHVAEFSGAKQFTPAFTLADECERNCSFSSGHSSAAFFFLALAMLFKYRRAALLIAFSYGCMVSFARIAAGGHFLSDCVVSFFIMALVTDWLYWLMQPDGDRSADASNAPATYDAEPVAVHVKAD